MKRAYVEVSAAMILIVGVAVYHKYVEGLTAFQLIIIGTGTFAAALAVAFAAAWVFSRPRDVLKDFKSTIIAIEHERHQFNAELKSALMDFLHSQPFVSEEMLAVIEKDAHDIWVVTTDLKNDVNPGKLRDSVESNLATGKSYSYFIPSPKNPNFPEVARNEQGFKKWVTYDRYRTQIQFIHLPDDTLFLFREVVVYNPIVNPNVTRERAQPMGFTYFDTGGARDRLMKVPPDYLDFLIAQLNRYRDDIGLKTAIETLIQNLQSQLDSDEVAFLARLLGQRTIEDRVEYKRVLTKMRGRIPDLAAGVEKSLQPYLERAV